MKIRVKEVKTETCCKFYPQYKGWFFWKCFTKDVDTGTDIFKVPIHFNSLPKARGYAVNYRKRLQAEVVIHEIEEASK